MRVWPTSSTELPPTLTLEPTFTFQLAAFLGHLAAGAPYDPRWGGRRDTVANMDAIDRVYRAAGMDPRPLHRG